MDTLRVLTVRQPFASLIIAGIKHIENRSWTTPHRGIIAIHAGKTIKSTDMDSAKRLCEKSEIPFPDIEFPTGGIIGLVGLMGMVYMNVDDEIDGDYQHYEDKWLEWWNPVDYGWILKKAKPTKFIPIKGMLGLWSINKDIFK